MRTPKGYKNPIPEHLEKEMAKLNELLCAIDKRFSCKEESRPDANLVDEYNAAVEKYNAEVRNFNPCKEMIFMTYDGFPDLKRGRENN